MKRFIKIIVIILLCALILTGCKKRQINKGCEHDLEFIKGYAATCIKEGTKDHYQCKKCLNMYDDKDCKKIIYNISTPKLGHDYARPEYIWSEDFSAVKAMMVCYHDSSHEIVELAKTTKLILQDRSCESGEIVEYSANFMNPYFDKQKKIAENPEKGPLGHDYRISYLWYNNNTTVVAKGICNNNSLHFIEETGNVEKNIISEATCVNEGKIILTATFENPLFESVTKETTYYNDHKYEHGETGNCINCGATASKFSYDSELKGYKLSSTDDNTQHIVIPKIYNSSPVVKIGGQAFSSKVESITIPSTIKCFDSFAFNNCVSLKNIYYDGSVDDLFEITLGNEEANPMRYAQNIYVKNEADEYELIKDIVIPLGVTKLSNMLFYNIKSLTSITIPSSVISIGKLSFENSYNLTDVYFDGTINDWLNITISDPFTSPMNYGQNFYIKNEDNEYELVNEVIIPQTIKSIPSYAFYGFDNLIGVLISKNVVRIGNQAFANCPSLVDVINESSLTIERGSSNNGYVGYNAFEIKNETPFTYVNVDDFIFYEYNDTFYLISYVGNQTNIVLPESYMNYSYEINKKAFINNNIESIVISPKVTKIGYNAFYGCTNLQTVYYDGTINDWMNILFEDDYSTPMFYAKDFYLNELKGYQLLTEVVIPEDITVIKDYSFFGFNNLTNVVIHANVINFGNKSFFACDNLKSIYYDGPIDNWVQISFLNKHSNPLYYADEIYFKNESDEYALLTEISFTTDITTIGAYSFIGYDRLTKIIIPYTVEIIETASFTNCKNLNEIIIEANARLNKIQEFAFYNCSSLNSFTLPNCLLTIEDCAFENCYRLLAIINHSSLDLKMGDYNNGYISYYALSINNDNHSKIQNVNDYLFFESDGVAYLIDYVGNDSNLVLPKSYNGNQYKINNFAFLQKDQILSITIPTNVIEIGQEA